MASTPLGSEDEVSDEFQRQATLEDSTYYKDVFSGDLDERSILEFRPVASTPLGSEDDQNTSEGFQPP